jgi:hypothetical protein
LVNEKLLKYDVSKKLKNKINFLQEFAKLNNIKVLDLCLSFVTKYKVNKLVIGFDDLKNLKDVLNFKKKYNIGFKKFMLKEKNIIDPRYWKYEKK